jgi:DNA-binding PadR family transcriptional regulator
VIVPPRDVDPRSWLPLTPLAFQALLALADTERHGYAIIREIEAHTSGHVRLRTGTLYTLLQRLLDERLIEESEARPTAGDDTRRRYYALTSLGRSVLTAEAHRLEGLVGAARRKGVLGRSRG